MEYQNSIVDLNNASWEVQGGALSSGLLTLNTNGTAKIEISGASIGITPEQYQLVVTYLDESPIFNRLTSKLKIAVQIQYLDTLSGSVSYQTFNCTLQRQNKVLLNKYTDYICITPQSKLMSKVTILLTNNTSTSITYTLLNFLPSIDINASTKDAIAALTGIKGGHIVIVTDKDNKPSEILIMDTMNTKTATMVWRWGINGLSHSSTGINGPYNVAISQSGQIDANFLDAITVKAEDIIGGQLSGVKIKTIPAASTGPHIEVHEQYIDFINTSSDVEESVFSIGTNMPGAEVGKPQLFFKDGCSIDTYQGIARFRKDAKNYTSMGDQDFSIYMTDPVDSTKSKAMFNVTPEGVFFNGKKLGDGEGGVEYPHSEVKQSISYLNLMINTVTSNINITFI